MKILDSEKNFLAEEFGPFEKCKIAVLPVPYEHTVSYGGGTLRGPAAILDASAYVEFYDDEFDRELCFEQGIATLEPLDLKGAYDKEALNTIANAVDDLIKRGKFVVTLGGEHTISTAPIEAHFRHYKDMCILHFDAHSDLRDEYEGTKWSHACFMARVAEFFPNDRIHQVGIRAQCKEEAEFIRSNGIKTYYASAIKRGLHGVNWAKEIVSKLGDQVYVTFDVDYFDPSIMPSTGTPEPNGFLYHETMNIFREIVKAKKRIIGFDVVELAPVDGLAHPDLTAARLIYKMLNFAFAGQ